MKKEFTKADLKVGYLVVDRDGNIKMVMPTQDGMIVVYRDGTTWGDMNCINDDLTYHNNYHNHFDIMKVYGFSKYGMEALGFKIGKRPLLWERKEPKKMTVAEIEKALGYEVEIVSES